MTQIIRLRLGRTATRMTRPKRWAGRAWASWYVVTAGLKVWGATRQHVGSVLTGYEDDGEYFPLYDHMSLTEIVAMQRRKVADGQGEGTNSAASIETKPISRIGSLVSHCAVTRYSDGSPRTPGRVTIETRGAVWQVSCTDPDTCAVLRANGPTLHEALMTAALLLESEDTLWEPAPWLRGDDKKRRRK